MKPKNKFQKRVVELSAALSCITDQQERWACENIFKRYYAIIRNRFYCLECGHKWHPENVLYEKLVECACPVCNKKLEYFNYQHNYRHIIKYWSVLDYVDDFQVVRVFHTTKFLKKYRCPGYRHCEIAQHWIRTDGKIESLYANRNAMTCMMDLWVPGSKLEVRGKNTGFHRIFDFIPDGICPPRRVHPILRRNGYKGHLHGLSPQCLFLAIMDYPKAETLLKSKQIPLLKKFAESFNKEFFDNNKEFLDKYWGSICIAIRNNWIIKDPITWKDYLELLIRFGKDLRNPHYICPDDLEREHNRYVEKARKADAQKRFEELKAEMDQDEPAYRKRVERFFDIRIRAGDIEIVPLKSVHDVYWEGSNLRHCLFTNKYHRKTTSLLLSARKDGQPIETIEVDLQTMKPVQARGMNNRPTDYHDLIVTAMEKNIYQIVSKAG